MPSEELKSVEEVYQFFRRWELQFPIRPSESEIESIKIQLLSLSGHASLEISKLSRLSSLIRASASLPEIFTCLVPIERALNKTLRDEEFSVRSDDKLSQQVAERFPLFLVLENFRSAFNVGAFFRLGEALGASEIILTGYSPSPENQKVKKTTMGTEQWMPWQFKNSTQDVILDFDKRGVQTIALETSQKALPIEYPFLHQPTAFLFGNERFGLDLGTLRMAKEIREISLQGQKNSLNVATCGAICAYEWIRQWKIASI